MFMFVLLCVCVYVCCSYHPAASFAPRVSRVKIEEKGRADNNERLGREKYLWRMLSSSSSSSSSNNSSSSSSSSKLGKTCLYMKEAQLVGL